MLKSQCKIVQNLTNLIGHKRPNKLIRTFGNKLGLAWWAKVETQSPDVTYWFGPFLTKRSLKGNLNTFLEDLNNEGSNDITHTLIRCKRTEPLTIEQRYNPFYKILIEAKWTLNLFGRKFYLVMDLLKI